MKIIQSAFDPATGKHRHIADIPRGCVRVVFEHDCILCYMPGDELPKEPTPGFWQRMANRINALFAWE